MSQFKKIFLISLIIFILISSPVYCEEIYNGEEIERPDTVNYIDLQIIQTGEIYASGQLEWLKINITVPQSDNFQTVSRKTKTIKDDVGNDIAEITIDNPTTTIIEYSITSNIISRSTQLTSIPTDYTISDETRKFLESTENIQSDNTRISRLAEEITIGSDSDYEKIAKLAIWVNEYITYDTRYSSETKDALWVLDNKKGVCAEYTTLFTALSRSIGIPARYTSAYAYGDNGWEKHAYAEVYIGKWISVDPLWLEIGNIDATHIKYTSQFDNKVINNIGSYGLNLEKLEWSKDDTEFIINKIRKEEPIDDYKISATMDKLHPGEEFIVYLEFTGKDYRVLDLSLESCSSQNPIIDIVDKSKKVIIEPGVKKIITWKGSVSDNLEKNYIYTCPLTLNARHLKTRTINMTIETTQDTKSTSIEPHFKTDIIKVDTDTILYINSKKIRGDGNTRIGIISELGYAESEYELDTTTLSIPFSITPEEIGKNRIYIYTSTGEVEEIEFDVEETGNIFIEKIEAPDKIVKGAQEIAKIYLKNTGNTEEIKTIINGEIRRIELNGEKVLESSIDSSIAGITQIKARIEGKSGRDEKQKDIEIFEVPKIDLKYISYDYSKNIAKISIATSYKAKDVSLDINGKNIKIGNLETPKSIELSILQGTTEIDINFKDIGDNTHSTTSRIIIEDESFINKIIRIIKELLGIGL